MRTSRLPYDFTAEFRAHQQARRRARAIALTGAILLCATAGIGLGALAGLHHSLWHVISVFAITAWGLIGLHYLLTRH